MAEFIMLLFAYVQVEAETISAVPEWALRVLPLS